jgi:glycosyltransferase involved in cell wall biosynthesis
MTGATNPLVATVIPILNEQDSIIACLSSLVNQTVSFEQHIVVVLDGGSTDQSVKLIEQFIEQNTEGPEIILTKNAGKYVAEARNLAMDLVPNSVKYFLEIIGHCTVNKNHIAILLEEMARLESVNEQPIGALGCKVSSRLGQLELVESWVEGALLSPFGSGSGQFDNFTGTVQTSVPAFCLHSRTAIEQIGGWDTDFITSQDSDLSMRMIDAGFLLFKTDLVEVNMTKRKSLKSWSKMGFRYGYWRTRIVRKHPKRFSIREILPWFGVILTLFLLVKSNQFWYFPATLYGAVLLLESLRLVLLKRRLSLLVGLPICIFLLHTMFSLGLVYGIIGKPSSFNDRESNNGNLQ